ncbi:hypothetical protein [uncultured Pantoea sp.]|uniref:hypothetical protein n=1 Tax=uncultured Pantoea sp. TaxID=218084 RepID=UPI0025DEF4E4|nr:hypothetical protein [uncultured Pantoea sp.]
MKNLTFYAVIDRSNGGVCSVKHDEYKSLKAVFSSLHEAEEAVKKAAEHDLQTQIVNIIDAKK